jgi:uncharacterized protein YfaQ (DUF2300 family)
MAATVKSLERELGAMEASLEHAKRTSASLARAKAEAEARAAKVDALMRARLEEVTRTLAAEARLTEDLLDTSGARSGGAALTMRNVDNEQVALSPGVARANN